MVRFNQSRTVRICGWFWRSSVLRTVPTSVPRHCANTVCIVRQTVPRTVPRIVPRTVYCAKNCAKNGVLYQELCQEMCPYCANNCANNYNAHCAKNGAKMLAQSHKKGHSGTIFNEETPKKRIYPVFFLTVLDWLNGWLPKSYDWLPKS